MQGDALKAAARQNSEREREAEFIGVSVRQWPSAGAAHIDTRPVFVEDASAAYAFAAECAMAEVGTDSTHRDYWIARAQVYATLAVAARPVR